MSDKKKKFLQQICINCDSEMAEHQFYRGRSNVFDTARYSICKNCAQRLGNQGVDALHDILRVLNIPFIPEIYSEAKTKENPTSYYLLVLNNPRKRLENGIECQSAVYSDSPTFKQIEDVDEYTISDSEKLRKLAALF